LKSGRWWTVAFVRLAAINPVMKEYLDLEMDLMFKQLFGHPSRKRIAITFMNCYFIGAGRGRIVDVQ